MTRCLLHIGAPKTGSTALQKFLHANRDRLHSLGWCYPSVSLRGFGHHDLAFLVGGGYPEWATRQERPLEDLVRELADVAADCTALIISSENFYLLPNPPGVARMLETAGISTADTRIIVYLRRQDEAHLSWYNQAVKAQGYTGTITDSIAATRDLWDYRAQIEKWAAVFGRDALTVRIYSQETLHGGDIRRDFLDVAGLPQEDFEFPTDDANSRINAEIVEFQRLINRLPLSPQEKRGAHKELIALTAATDGTDLFDDPAQLGIDERAAILASYADGNDDLARIYLGHKQLFDQTMPDGLPRLAEPTKLTSEKLVFILGWLISHRPTT